MNHCLARAVVVRTYLLITCALLGVGPPAERADAGDGQQEKQKDMVMFHIL